MPTRSASSRRRASAQCGRIAEEVRLAAATLGMSVHQLALRAGTSWWTAKHVLDGDSSISVQTLSAVAEAAGLDLVLRAYPSRPMSLRDTGQLGVIDQLCEQRATSWQPAIEHSVGTHGEAIDLCLFGPTEILACEVERRITDWQAQYRRADSKRQALAARHQRPVRLVIVIEDTKRNRDVIAPHLSLLRTAMPAGSRAVLRGIRRGIPIGHDGLLWIRGATSSRISA